MRLQKIIFVSLFIVLFFAARFHFYRTPLFGEEGVFAELIVNQPENPKIILTGRADGQNLHEKTSHPIGLYSVIRVCGSLFRPFLTAVDWQNDAEITPRLRFVFSLFQFAIFLPASLYIVLSRKRPMHILLAAIFIAVVISPIALKTSWNLQVDGSVGVLMNGLFSLAVILLLKNNSMNPLTGAILFATSIFLGLGKQEWSMVLLVAIVISAVYFSMLNRKTSQPVKPYYIMLLIILAGSIAGNIIGYLSLPDAYMGGFKVLWSFSRAQQVLDSQPATQAIRLLNLTMSRLPWICTSIALIAISGVSMLRNRRWPKPVEFFLFVFGLGLFGAFFISLHNSEPRYFAPSLIVLTLATVAIFPQKMNKRFCVIITSIVFIMFASSGAFLYARIVKRPVKNYFDVKTMPMSPGQAAIISPAVAWNKMELDFVSYYTGRGGATWYCRKYNKELYPSDLTWSGSDVELQDRVFK